MTDNKNCFYCIYCQGEECPNPYHCVFELDQIRRTTSEIEGEEI